MTMFNAPTLHICYHTGIGRKLAEMTEGKPVASVLVLVGLITLYLLCCVWEKK